MQANPGLDRLRLFAILATLALMQTAATLSTAARLDAYRSAVATVKRPAFVEFDYTHTRSAPNRIVTELHRVYRTQDGQERNDTVMINGTAIVPAVTHILHRPVWPYDVGQFIVSADDYDIAPAAAAVVSGRKALGFKLTRKASANFMLKNLYVDPRRYLPVRETFAVTGADCSGDGIISFGAAGQYWLPTSVQVTCSAAVTNGPAVFKESIRFSNYAFPKAIPADVFTAGQPSSGGGATPTVSP